MGLETVELVMAFEAAFELTIPNADAEKLQTVGDVIDYVTARFAAAGHPRPRTEVAATVVRITCEQGGTTPDKLTEATSFVNDLGMN